MNWYPLLQAHHHLPARPGVYAVRHRISGMEYIGISKNMRHRVMRHRSAKALDSYLHRVIRTHGVELFDAAVLQEADVPELADLEIQHIAARGTFAPTGYNLTRGGGIIHTETHSAERRARSAETARRTHLGAKRSEETKARMSKALKGRVMSDTARAALMARITGRIMPDTVRSAIRAISVRPTLVWVPGAMLPVEYPTLQEAIAAMGKANSTVKLCMREGRATKDGYAFAFVKDCQ